MLMPVVKYREALDSVMRRPVFGTEDLHHEKIPNSYSKKLLHMLAKSGKIRSIEKGKYTCLDDPVAVAAFITRPSYISLWMAMSIRNLTDQVPFAIEVVTSRRRFRSRIEFLGTPIIFHTVSPKLMFGYENIIWKGNIRVPVASREKIIIDAVYTGGISEEEIMPVLKVSDTSMLRKYAKLAGDKPTEDKIERMIKCLHRKR